jgi:hypothetical protein
MASGLPIALACGGDLLPLKGIKDLSLIFQIKVTPPDDPWALPKTIKVVLKAPAKDYQALARGTLSADDFLNRHPPRQIGKIPKMPKKKQPLAPAKNPSPGDRDGVALQPKKEGAAGAGGAGAPQKHGGVPASGRTGD